MEKVEMTVKQFNDYIEKAFYKGVKVGRLEVLKENFKEETGYDFGAYMKAKNLVDSWMN